MQKKFDLMKHAIGLDRKSPYKRHSKLFYKPYRNYFFTSSDDRDWNSLVDLNYAKKNDANKEGYSYFTITRKGLDVLGEYMNCKIYDEED